MPRDLETLGRAYFEAAAAAVAASTARAQAHRHFELCCDAETETNTKSEKLRLELTDRLLADLAIALDPKGGEPDGFPGTE